MAKPEKRKKKLGRPTKFSTRLAERIFALAQEGKTDPQIAAAVGISRSTLNNWKGSHDGFLDAIKASKDVADELVEAALFQRAIGYRHRAVRILFDSEGGRFVTKKYTEVYPPDTTAAKFWLSNRKPKKWRDVQKIEHSVSVAEELKKARERVKKGR
jgi:hypothetical protein